ncbi:hypothetical protein K9L97_02990 [Candidatus Woesearchaeota archaeon]|nr:hypothetical protein [Candidatus Woesearchaeota archaeon]
MEEKKIDEAGRIGVKAPSVKDILGKKHPEKKFIAGSISATIWLNTSQSEDGKEIFYRTVNLGRSYLDKEGNWQNTSSLRTSDLPKAILVLNKAYEFLALKDTEQEDD